MQQVTPANLVGSLILCPHCNQMLRCVAVGRLVRATNPHTNKADSYYPIQLSDGEWARMWVTEW